MSQDLQTQVDALTKERDDLLNKLTMPAGQGYDATAGTCIYCFGVGACPRCWGRIAIDSMFTRAQVVNIAYQWTEYVLAVRTAHDTGYAPPKEVTFSDLIEQVKR